MAETDKLPNKAQFAELVDTLQAMTNVIAGGTNPGSVKSDLPKFVLNVRNRTAQANYPEGTVLPLGMNPTVTSQCGTTAAEGTAGITAVSVDSEKFTAKVGNEVGGKDIRFVYDGAWWHKDTQAGDAVIVSDYGVTTTGTPKEGDYIEVLETSETFEAQVVRYKDDENGKPLAEVLSRNVVRMLQFEPNQMMMAVTKKAMPAGKYKFELYHAEDDDQGTHYDGEYVFTITKAIAVGGGFTHNYIGRNFSWGGGKDTDPTDGTITTYGVDSSDLNATPVLEENIVVRKYTSSDSDAADLGCFSCQYFSTKKYTNDYGVNNWTRRVRYGSGDFCTSLIFQWLNSDGDSTGKWWKKLSVFSIHPKIDYAGFLHGIDTGIVNSIRKTKVKYYMYDADYSLMTAENATKPLHWATNQTSATTDGHVITVECLVYLPSVEEMGFKGQYQDSLAGNTVFTYFEGKGNADRVKRTKTGANASYWWLRSSYPWSSSCAADVSPGGALNYSGGYNRFGCVPCFVIG